MALIEDPRLIVKNAQSVLASTTENIFKLLPKCIKIMIEKESWKKVTNKNDEHFKSFEEFCETPLPKGLEVKIEDLLLYLKDAPEVKALVLNEIKELGKIGGKTGNKNASILNVTNEGKILPSFSGIKPKQIRHTPYLVKRIKRDFPEQYKRFEEGEKITVLATELGIKTKQLTIYESDAVETAKRIKSKFNAEFVKMLKENL